MRGFALLRTNEFTYDKKQPLSFLGGCFLSAKAAFSARKDSYVIASQCAHWRGNPHPLTHLDDETAKKGERIATGDLRSPSQ